MIIKDLLKNTGIDRSINEQLLQFILCKNRSFLISHDDYCLTLPQWQQYQQAVTAWQQGQPLAYIVGYQGFWKHDFLVNEHTLIPRPDTEILVETVSNLAKNSLSKINHQPLKILDLGTGSGCIAISLADELPHAHVTAVDISTDALAIARQNAERIGVSNIEFLHSHWFDQLPPQKFDIIVSNPPYIDPSDPHLAGLTHEPITALTAENHGLADIEQIVRVGQGFLVPYGLLAVEHGYDQAEKVREIFDNNSFNQVATVKDFGGNDRVTYGFFK